MGKCFIKLPVERLIRKENRGDTRLILEQDPGDAFVPGNYLVVKIPAGATVEVELDEELSAEYDQSVRVTMAEGFGKYYSEREAAAASRACREVLRP